MLRDNPRLGDPAGAAAAYEALLTDYLRVLGPDHPDTLTTRHDLAHWRGTAGDPAGAAAAYEALPTDRLRILGPDHPDTLTTRNNPADGTQQARRPPPTLPPDSKKRRIRWPWSGRT
jgi:hypothetical protein